MAGVAVMQSNAHNAHNMQPSKSGLLDPRFHEMSVENAVRHVMQIPPSAALCAELVTVPKAGAANAVMSLATVGQNPAHGLPYVCNHVGWMCEQVGSKDAHTAKAAGDALRHLSGKVFGFCLRPYLQGLETALNGKAKPVQKETALEIISGLSKAHPLPIGQELDHLIPLVSDLMTDSKKSVSTLATTCMEDLLKTCGNADLVSVFPAIVRCNQSLKNVTESIEEIASCVFVQNVDAPALAALIPVMVRGLNSTSDVTVRRTCVIIDNMCKLVDDPREG
jgi:elongation factor 3